MLVLTARVGGLAQRIGPRIPMTVVPLLSAGGLALFSGIGPGDHYPLPAAGLFGLGMTITVPRLTAAVLGAVEQRRAGLASGVNNAAARLAGLLGIAVLPALDGIAGGGGHDGETAGLEHGYATALRIS